MTTKLRPIRTTTRAASVKRSAVTSAAKAVIVSRESFADRFSKRVAAGKRAASSDRK